MQVLHAACCEPDGYAPLASLSRLANLQLYEANHLPACLSQLTLLRELCLRDAIGGMVAAAAPAAVDAALRHLTGVSWRCSWWRAVGAGGMWHAHGLFRDW